VKNRTFRTTLAIAVTAAAFALGACGSDSDSAADSSTAAATTSAAGQFEAGVEEDAAVEGQAPTSTAPPNLPKPTAAELNDRLTRAFDSSVPAEEKTSWIQDAERDPQLVDKLVDAAETNNVKVEITGVGEPVDGTLKADANVTIDGRPVEGAYVEFVAEGDTWKVSHDFTCDIVRSAELDSAACQAQ